MTRYHAYGVSVASEIPLPLPARAPSDRSLAHVDFVEADERDFEAFPSAPSSADTFICDDVPGRGTYLRWPRFYDFTVNERGSRVACRALDGCDTSVFQNFLFGQVVAVALVRQGSSRCMPRRLRSAARRSRSSATARTASRPCSRALHKRDIER